MATQVTIDGVVRDRLSVPELRDELIRFAENEGWRHESYIKALARAAYRKPPVRKTRAKLPRLTAERAEEVRMFAKVHPELSNLDIANHFRVNPGRVSEALNHIV